MDLQTIPFWAVGAGILAILFAFYFAKSVLSNSPGNAKMQEISKAIQEGAMAFLNREYRSLIPIVIIIGIVLLFAKNWQTAISFVVGSALSAVAGYIGMSITTRANCRTTEAARTSLNKALGVAFRGGSVMGLSVVGLGLLGNSPLLSFSRSFDD